MTKHLVLETAPSEKPLLLLVDISSGEQNFILNLLIETFYKDTTVYVLSKKRVSSLASKISPLGIHLLDRIREKIEYAILFLDSEKQKADVLEAVVKLVERGAKILLFIPVRQKAHFLDVFLEVKSRKNISIFFVGDVFGNSFKHTKLSKLIAASIASQEIEIVGNGLLPIFPISQEDLAHSTKHILLGMESPSLFYNAYYTDPQTVLSLAHHVQRIEPELSLSFKHANYEEAHESFASVERMLSERIGLKPEYIKHVYGFDKSVEKLSLNTGVHTAQKKKTKNKIIHKNLLFQKAHGFFSKVLIGLFLYGLLSLIFIFMSVVFLFQGVEKLLTGNINQGVQRLTVSNTLYKFSMPSISLLTILPDTIYTKAVHEYARIFIEVQEDVPSAVLIISDFEKNKTVSARQLETLQNFSLDLYFLVQKFSGASTQDLKASKQYKNVVHMLPLVPFISELGGYTGEKSYVLLFQNSNELRPTGGFIGSVGYLTLEKGKIKSLLVEDVYDLDGQLKGHVEPHHIIRRYLQPSLYLRDSNFNPDFDVAASSSAFLYNIESKRRVDGVIALDTHVLQKLVEIAGPIKLDSTEEVLDSKNVLDILHDSIHEDYFEGSTKKKQMLGELIKKLTVLYESDNAKQLQLFEAIPDLLLSKHILFSFPSQSLQKAFLARGFSGSLKDTRLQVYDIPDFLSINEANIGVNKINAHTTRKVSYSARLENSTVFSDASLVLENKGQETYKSYIRFIIPDDASVTSIIINGQLQQVVEAVVNPILFERSAFQAPAGLEVDTEIQDGHKMVGFVLDTPALTTSNIHLLYSTSYDIKSANIDYSLLYIKQPGTNPYPFLAQISASDGYKLPVGFDEILLNEEIDGDIEVVSKLIKTR